MKEWDGCERMGRLAGVGCRLSAVGWRVRNRVSHHDDVRQKSLGLEVVGLQQEEVARVRGRVRGRVRVRVRKGEGKG